MLDRWLKPLSSWGLLVVSLVLFGLVSAIYFVFCWLVTGLIDRTITRKEREESYQRQGLPIEAIDQLMLPRDRITRLLRAAFSFGAAAAMHYLG